VTLRNHKTTAVTISIRDAVNLGEHWAGFKVEEYKGKFEIIGTNVLSIPVEVPAGGEATVRYKVIYNMEVKREQVKESPRKE
jgi:hypothetical protein